MKQLAFLRNLALCSLAVLVAGCGGGGSASSTSVPASSSSSTLPPIPPGPNEFLLFPNPQKQANGTLETNTLGYAQAYYRAIDPTSQRTTLEGFKTANGFYANSFKVSPQTVLFDDTHDLGYARKITFWVNSNGTSAAFVSNYLAGGFASYSNSDPQLNLQAAAANDDRWIVETNAIEFSAAPAAPGGINFTKFYVYNPAGNQLMTGQLDSRGPKFMPSVCISCHGGRGDPLTPPDSTGNPRFPLVYNSASLMRGDTGAHMQPVEVGIQVFEPSGQYSRASQEAALKVFNTQMVLCAYPLSPATQALNYAEDACRRPAIKTEWQGDTSGDLIREAYGGPGLPSSTWNDTYIAGDWGTNGQASLYDNGIVVGCRVCHKLRGLGVQSDIDFNTTEKFGGYADRVYAHVYDRGNMPLALLVYNSFQASSGPTEMANFIKPLGFNAFNSNGTVKVPGHPVADPGPDRVLSTGASTLNANMSLYASSFTWSLVSNPGNAASLSNPTTNGQSITFNASQNGTYVVQLVASNGSQSDTATVNIAVDSTRSPAPSAVTWTDVKAIVQENGPTPTLCLSCHVIGGNPQAPVIYANIDRAGTGNANDSTNDFWLYTDVRGRVNFTDIIASPILRKPSNHHHAGLLQPGFDISKPVGDPARVNYDEIVDWILNGAPYP